MQNVSGFFGIIAGLAPHAAFHSHIERRSTESVVIT
jgi:hypothetical protein